MSILPRPFRSSDLSRLLLKGWLTDLQLTRLRGFQDTARRDSAARLRLGRRLRPARSPNATASAKSASRCSSASSSISAPPARLPTSSKSRCTPSPIATRPRPRWRCGPRARRAWCAPISRRDWIAATPSSASITSGRCSGASVRRRAAFASSHQFGVEMFGRADAACDAELMLMIDELRARTRARARTSRSTRWATRECRPAFRAGGARIRPRALAELCEDCHQRLERNPLRLLDCKIDVQAGRGRAEEPRLSVRQCRAHFATVSELLTTRPVSNTSSIRGWCAGSTTTCARPSRSSRPRSARRARWSAGGRYDGLVESLGGAAVPGTGFAIGIERLALALRSGAISPTSAPHVAMVALGEAAARRAIEHRAPDAQRGTPRRAALAGARAQGAAARADKIGARFAVIIGENELRREVASCAILRQSAQREVAARARD